MNTELDQLQKISLRRALLRAKLDEAKVRFKELSRYSLNGGTFEITPLLLWEVSYLLGKQTEGPWLIIDSYGWPIEIADLTKFHEEIEQKYTSAKRRFHIDVVRARELCPPDLFE
jgi:hypothetical protein